MSKASFAFRVDASVVIGTGHVMRCLALAQGLREMGEECRFICRELEGHLGPRIVAEGFSLTLLPTPQGPVPEQPPSHAAWAGVDWEHDASETRAALGADVPDWLVLDHYAFDARWEGAACPEGTSILVFDDLADRPHVADILVDPSLGRENSDYDGLVKAGCLCLTGPRHAILRPDFSKLRAVSLADRAERLRDGQGVKELMIAVGGVDAGNATARVLDALARGAMASDIRLTIVMGSQAPHIADVRERAACLPCPVEVAVDVKDMAERMARADLAIGAGGTTSWERCCLGLPSLVLQIASNQSEITRALVEAGAAIDPGSPDAGDFDLCLVKALNEALSQLHSLSVRAAAVCDGDGLPRLLARLATYPTLYRAATLADSRRVWEWRTASDLDRFSQSGRSPSFLEHHAWFVAALKDGQRIFRILMLGHLACGYVRLDLDCAERGTVSICVAPEARGQGLAAKLLEEARHVAAELGLAALDATVHPNNTASMSCFIRAGYRRGTDARGFMTFRLELEKTI